MLLPTTETAGDVGERGEVGPVPGAHGCEEDEEEEEEGMVIGGGRPGMLPMRLEEEGEAREEPEEKEP